MQNETTLAVGARLSSVRKAEGLKQIQMTKIFNVSPRVYSYIESGKAPLRPEMVKLLFEEFKVDLQWLFTGKAMPNSKEVLNTMRVSE